MKKKNPVEKGKKLLPTQRSVYHLDFGLGDHGRIEVSSDTTRKKREMRGPLRGGSLGSSSTFGIRTRVIDLSGSGPPNREKRKIEGEK